MLTFISTTHSSYATSHIYYYFCGAHVVESDGRCARSVRNVHHIAWKTLTPPTHPLLWKYNLNRKMCAADPGQTLAAVCRIFIRRWI